MLPKKRNYRTVHIDLKKQGMHNKLASAFAMRLFNFSGISPQAKAYPNVLITLKKNNQGKQDLPVAALWYNPKNGGKLLAVESFSMDLHTPHSSRLLKLAIGRNPKAERVTSRSYLSGIRALETFARRHGYEYSVRPIPHTKKLYEHLDPRKTRDISIRLGEKGGRIMTRPPRRLPEKG